MSKDMNRQEIGNKAKEHIASLCMIPGSLGVWESSFIRLAQAWGRIETEIRPTHIVFSADNGIVSEGYIGFGGEITKKHTLNMLHGGAAISSFASYSQVPLEIVDVGIQSEGAIGRDGKACKGTRNFLAAPAMTQSEYDLVRAKATQLVKELKGKEINLISFGEMGIGNTTTSAAVLSAVTGLDPCMTVGTGSGADEAMLAKKRQIVSEGLRKHAHAIVDVHTVIQCVGGFDIAALTAAMLACEEEGIPFVIDGFITAVALACASLINPAVRTMAFPSHLSRERGMTVALQFASIDASDVPIRGQMALGEGTGALMAVALLRMVHHAFTHMASFDTMMAEEEPFKV